MVAKKVWFEGERIYIETDDGRTLWQSILYYQRLRNATKEREQAILNTVREIIEECHQRAARGL